MRRYTAILSGLIMVSLVMQSPLFAEVLDATANGFTIRHEIVINAERSTVYQAAMANVGSWWSADHTVSGDAANLYMDARVSGCFCESLGEGAGLAHLTINFINPGVMVRFTGGLGPLGLMGVAGNMTWEFATVDEGTAVTLHYAIGGYMAGGLDSISQPVNAVLVEAMTRLASFVEHGSPTEPAAAEDNDRP